MHVHRFFTAHKIPLWALLFATIALPFLACSSDSKSAPPIATDGDEESEAADGDDSGETQMPEEPTTLYFGYAEVDVTPEVGVVLGGFGAPGGVRANEGHNDPLLAQAAYFKNDIGDGFLLIAIDNAGYSFDFGGHGAGIMEIRERIADAVEGYEALEAEHILITQSHSHAATDMIGFWVQVGEALPEDLVQWHADKLTEVALAAIENTQEADLYYAESELVGYSGRDGGCSDVNDNHVNILQVRNKTGEALATLVNYAKHPTMLPEGNKLVSSDFVWGFRETLEAATGAPAIYLQGFLAAVHNGEAIRELEGDNFEKAYAVGEALTEATLLGLEKMTLNTAFDIRHRHARYESKAEGEYMLMAYEYFDMPKRYVRENEAGELIVENIELSWHKLGEAEFAAMPGEPTPEYSLFLRERMVSPSKFTVGLANDCIGYIIDPESLAKDTAGQFESYELKMGLGMPLGVKSVEVMESLGWFDGAYLEE